MVWHSISLNRHKYGPIRLLSDFIIVPCCKWYSWLVSLMNGNKSQLICWVLAAVLGVFSCTHYWGSTVIHIKATKLGHLWKVGVSGNFQRGSKGCLIWWEMMRWKDFFFPFQFTNVNCPKVLDGAMKLQPTLDPYLLTTHTPKFDQLVIGAIADLHLPPPCHKRNVEMQSGWPPEDVFLPIL